MSFFVLNISVGHLNNWNVGICLIIMKGISEYNPLDLNHAALYNDRMETYVC